MVSTSTFRLSLYLTLALACGCLGYAEAAVFPEVGVLAVAAAVALAVIYRLETRVNLLTIPAANKVGAGLAVVTFVWAGFRIVREFHSTEPHSVGTWQILLVALFGPVLMTAIPAKLLRREKHAGDYWQLHAAGLACVGLAGAMAEDAISFAIMAAFVGLAVWNLSLFFVARSGGAVPPIPHSGSALHPPVVAAGPVVSPRRSLVRAWSWVALATLIALPPFFLTPRSTAGRMDFASRRREVGYTPDQILDLNRTGPLVATPDVAFEVEATADDGRPKDDLNPDQRWRAVTRADYSGGVWQRTAVELPWLSRTATMTQGVPDLGPGRYRLAFQLPGAIRGGFLSDPVVWVPGQPSPIISVGQDGPANWRPAADGTFIRPFGRGRPLHYAQYTRPLEDPDLGPPLEYARESEQRLEDPRSPLVFNPVPRVKEYADGLVEQMARSGALPPGFRDPIRLVPRPEHREAVARAFARNLSSAAGLTYSVQAKRENVEVDPVEDFLFHAKAGHCQQFATALVLMLRSQGIPTVLVHGFRGCDSLGGGRYAVRQDSAHVWAEALIVRPGPGGKGRVWHWLSLDPTPAGPGAADAGAGWWDNVVTQGKVAFGRYFLQYDPDQRDRLLANVATAAATTTGFVALLGLVAVLTASRFLLRRRARTAPPAESGRWFDRLLAVLAAHGFAPEPGATPREFAAEVASSLRSRFVTAAVADVPLEWAESHYGARFGGIELSPDRRQYLDSRLSDLSRALAT
jgi:transglutaminase-like putative cysteine protease